MDYGYKAGIVKGFGKKGTCQDSYLIWSTPSCLLAAVADGHGGKSHIFSHEGASVACDVVWELFRELFLSHTLEEILSMLTINSDIWLSKRIEASWKEKILLLHQKLGRQEEPDIYNLYGTTLLSIVIGEGFIFALQIGDGDIVFVDSLPERVFPPVIHKGSETYSLCQKESWKYFSTKIIKCRPRLFCLSTDGLANSFSTDQGFLQVSADILDICDENGLNTLGENLPGWLESYTEQGGKDDIAAIVLYRGREYELL